MEKKIGGWGLVQALLNRNGRSLNRVLKSASLFARLTSTPPELRAVFSFSRELAFVKLSSDIIPG